MSVRSALRLSTDPAPGAGEGRDVLWLLARLGPSGGMIDPRETDGRAIETFQRQRAIARKQTALISSAFAASRPTPEATTLLEVQMSFMTDLKRFAINRMKARRHRQTVTVLDSLPEE